MQNTHPFIYKQFAFAHNGAVAPNEGLEALIAPHLREHITGTTDSERHFLALLSVFEKVAPIEAFRIHMNTLRQQLQSTSLNCLLLTPHALYAACDFDANSPLALRDPDYFPMFYKATPDAVVVASTGLGQGAGWQTLKNGQMLVVERGTLKADASSISRTIRETLYRSNTYHNFNVRFRQNGPRQRCSLRAPARHDHQFTFITRRNGR